MKLVYGVPLASKLRFLVMFIKPATFTEHQSISTRNGNPSIFAKHQSTFNKDRWIAISSRDRLMFGKGRGFDKHY